MSHWHAVLCKPRREALRREVDRLPEPEAKPR